MVLGPRAHDLASYGILIQPMEAGMGSIFQSEGGWLKP